ncbi:hypothetical protein IV500_04750 [Paeniglutamicibacter antarcticus]|uniref:Uncharacterized protein n=1 Tax=Arthrobacter terrae TaxID=2935737 RepID=A0A931CHK9_9MICC|nr:hypothetical protein [Arthrobacter terrae]MBG0738727.1 hypothetical protein [Arthrobacter terrae]
MKRNLRSAADGARRKELRRRKRARMKYVCCELCLRKVPGRLGRAEHFRPTGRAAALRDQALNS